MVFKILSTIVALGLLNAIQSQSNGFGRVLSHKEFGDCQGKDAANYTILGQFSQTLTGGGNINTVDTQTNQLIQCGPDGQLAVSLLKVLTQSVLLVGAYTQPETLWLAISGPLQGKYLYEKVIHLSFAYLKRYSSVLGYNYVTTKSATLLIGDHVDLSIFLSPAGAFEAFKRLCTTQCSGKQRFVS